MRIDQTVESGEERVCRTGKPEAEEHVLGSPDIKGVGRRKEKQRGWIEKRVMKAKGTQLSNMKRNEQCHIPQGSPARRRLERVHST